jgi:hypothetical protein
MALAEFAPADAHRSVERIARVAGVPMSSRGSDAKKLAIGVASTHLASSNTFSPNSATSRRLRGSLGITLAIAVLGGVAAWLWLRGSEPSASEHALSTAPSPAEGANTAAAASQPTAAAASQPTAAAAAPVAQPSAVDPAPLEQAPKSKPRQRPRSKPAKPAAPSSQPPPPFVPARAEPNPLDGRH